MAAAHAYNACHVVRELQWRCMLHWESNGLCVEISRELLNVADEGRGAHHSLQILHTRITIGGEVGCEARGGNACMLTV